jgi:phage-related protein
MADFTILADKAIEQKIEYNVLISDFENLVEQRRLKSVNPRREWQLKFENRTSTEMLEVQNFFISKFGSYTSFTWVCPIDSTQYTVRFSENGFQCSKVAYDIYNFNITFIEVK